jgi:hypothetical protein
MHRDGSGFTKRYCFQAILDQSAKTEVSMKFGIGIVYFCLYLLPLQTAVYAQNLQYPAKQNPIASFATTVGADVLHVYSSPLRFNQKDGLKLLALSAMTIAFITSLDEPINKNFIERERRSFPSGHSTSAFAMMTVLAKQYKQWWIAIPAYTFGVSVAMQRIESQQHWSADVLVGSAIGYWVGSALVARNKRQSKSSTVSACIFGNRAGIRVSF